MCLQFIDSTVLPSMIRNGVQSEFNVMDKTIEIKISITCLDVLHDTGSRQNILRQYNIAYSILREKA